MIIRKRVMFLAYLSYLILGVIIGVTPAVGTNVIKMDISKLSQTAALIVEGEVTATRSGWNPDHTRIYTYVTLNVTDVYAGKIAPGRLEIRMLGGVVGDTAMIIPGSPGFSAREHVVLFLHGTGQLIPIVGFYQGKLSFSIDPATGREVVGNQDVGFFDKQELKSAVLKAREER